MEEKEDVMTDNQWDALIIAMMKIARRCKTADEVFEELRGMLIKKEYPEPQKKPED